MTAPMKSSRPATASAEDRARIEALVELAVVTGALPPSGTPESARFDEQMTLWSARLRGFAPESVRAGCDAAALDWQYRGMPPLGFVVERIRRASGAPAALDAKDAAEAEADAAWAGIRQKLRACGPYFDPELTVEEAWAVKALGGWWRLCQASSRDLDFLSKDFRRLYMARRACPAVEQGPRAVAALSGSTLAIEDASDVLQ